jgi:hypothetical protein
MIACSPPTSGREALLGQQVDVVSDPPVAALAVRLRVALTPTSARFIMCLPASLALRPDSGSDAR